MSVLVHEPSVVVSHSACQLDMAVALVVMAPPFVSNYEFLHTKLDLEVYGERSCNDLKLFLADRAVRTRDSQETISGNLILETP